jgi:hypothetical protein
VLRVESHPGHQLLDGLLGAALGLDALDVVRRGDDRADCLARIERRERVLEDDLHVAPVGTHPGPVQVSDVRALEDDDAARRLIQPGHQPAGRRLPAARLPHQAEGFAGVHGEVHPVDRLDRTALPLEDDSPGHREVPLQPADLEQDVAAPRAGPLSLNLC